MSGPGIANSYCTGQQQAKWQAQSPESFRSNGANQHAQVCQVHRRKVLNETHLDFDGLFSRELHSG